jgi:hypothetical protein
MLKALRTRLPIESLFLVFAPALFTSSFPPLARAEVISMSEFNRVWIPFHDREPMTAPSPRPSTSLKDALETKPIPRPQLRRLTEARAKNSNSILLQ